MSANAIATLRDWTTANHDVPEVIDALAAVEVLLEAAKRLAPKAAFGVSTQVAVKNGDLIRLAAAVRRVEADQ